MSSPEPETEDDPAVAGARDTGGDPGQGGDAGSTTGTGRNDGFVGRVSGQDEGFAGETGAEARS